MAIDFPNSPSANDTFTVDDKAWIYSGGKWILQVTAQPLAIPVTITSVASGQFLKWNGTAWVNDAIDLGTDTTGSFVQSLVAGTGVTLSGNSGEGATPTVTVDTTVIQARVANVTDTEIGYLDGVTSAIQTQIDTKADLASPTFTGTVTIPSGASISGFAPLASPSLTGTPLSTTASAGTNTTQIATTAFVTTAVSILDGIGDVTITTIYAIGDTGPAGGKIFITPTTVGNSTGQYFEAAPFLNPDVTRTWATNVNSNQTTVVSGADGTAIGTGAQNTIDIVAQSGNVAATCAAAYASDYTYGGFSDWFLPSQNELAELYTNRASIGGYGSLAYWNSSENGSISCKYQSFSDGSQGVAGKDNISSVRPVRSFAAAPTPTSGDLLKWNGTAWVNAAGYALLASPTFTGTVTLPATTSIGTISSTELGYVNGVTSAIQTQFSAKANLASPTFTGTPTLPTGTIATTQTALDSTTKVATTAFVTTADNLKANLASPALTGTPTAPTAAAATNTTQVATTAFVRAEVTALVNGATATLDTLGEIATALGNDANLSTTLTTSIGLKAPLASPTFTGTVTIPSGASITAPTGLVKGDVGLGNVDNTSDANKPVSTASQTALDLKANLASPTFTGTVSGVTSTMVGLGNVDNTSDANKPVSTAQQTALDLKAPLASPTFTGTVTIPSGASISGFAPLASPSLTGTPLAPTAAGGTNTTQIATTAFVATAVSGATITSLDDVSDVTITTAANGDLLKWNGSVWVNAAGYALLASPTFTGTVTTSDLTVSGNLTVSGTTTSINTTTLNVADNIVILNNDVTGSPTENAGIEVERGTSTNVAIRWNETDDKWQFTNDGSTYTDIGAGGGATVSSAAPVSPLVGSIWFDSDTAQTFVYYDSQWIEIGSSGMAVLVSDSAPSSPIPGQLWFNSGNGGTYVYYSSAWTEVGAVPINALLNTINAKGDLLAGTADNTVGRLGVGTNGYFLKADSAQTTGLVWAAIPSVSILDDVGDVTVTSAASGQVLQWNGSAWINATVSTDIMTDSKNAALLVMDIGS